MATRRERVVLELEDNFTGDMLRAAAATELLNRELKRLGGGVNRDQSMSRMSRDARLAERDVSTLGRSAERTGNKIDTMSGRVGIFASVIASVGPGLIPIGAVGVPAVAGLAAQFGFAAAGAGVLIGSMQGVGTALKAVNKAAIEPTTQNLAAAKLAMQQISPAARGFVRELQSMEPQLKALRDTGATNMFPGFTEGLNSLESIFPRLQNIVGSIASALGDIGAETGASLASDRWAPFLDFLAREAPAALKDLAAIAGNTGHAMAELWMAFTPTNRAFSTFLVNASQDLDRWASGLSKTAGFQQFLDYVHTNGPQVGATLGAIANAFLQIVEAAAPLGGPVLRIIESLANALAALANSDIGTPLFSMVAALSALNMAMSATASVRKNFTSGQTQLAGGFNKQRASLRGLMTDWRAYTAVTQTAQGRAQATSTQMIAQREAAAKLGTSFRTTALAAGKAGALVGALALETTGLGDKMGATNTIALAMAGSMVGPWGAALGAGVGAAIDLAHANDDLRDSVTAARTAMRVGDITAMSAAYDRLAAKIRETGTLNTNPLSVTPTAGADRLKLASGYLTGATQKAKQEAANLAGAINGVAAASTGQELVRGFGFMGKGFSLTAAGARQASAALRANRAAAAQTAHQFITLGKDLNNAKVGLDGWIREMSRDADALNHFASNAQKAANRGLRQGLIKALQEAGPEGARRMKQLADATDAQLARANSAWARGQRAARNYTTAVGGDAQTAKQKIAAMRAEIARLKDKTVHLNEQGSAAARARIAALRAQIAALHDKYVTVHVNVSRSGHNLGGGAGTMGATIGADGMTVPGPRYPYADKVFAYLAPGEEVITNRHGEADRFRSDRAAGRIPQYADGGTVQKLAAGGTVATAGMTINFPMPSVLAQAVAAANAIALASANTARSAEEIRQAHLGDLHQQQQIRDLQNSLAERNTKSVGKGKHSHMVQTGLKLTGLDRTAAQAELADAKAQLTTMRAISDAGRQAIDSLVQSRADAKAQLTGGVDLFAGGASSAVRNVDRYVADVATAGQVMAQLRAKGASSLLLQQMQQHVLQGDARAAVRLGRAFLAQPALLGQLNSSLAMLGNVSSNVAALTTDPRFLGSGKFDATGAAPKVVQMHVALDQNQMVAEVSRRVAAELRAELVGA